MRLILAISFSAALLRFVPGLTDDPFNFYRLTPYEVGTSILYCTGLMIVFWGTTCFRRHLSKTTSLDGVLGVTKSSAYLAYVLLLGVCLALFGVLVIRVVVYPELPWQDRWLADYKASRYFIGVHAFSLASLLLLRNVGKGGVSLVVRAGLVCSAVAVVCVDASREALLYPVALLSVLTLAGKSRASAILFFFVVASLAYVMRNGGIAEGVTIKNIFSGITYVFGWGFLHFSQVTISTDDLAHTPMAVGDIILSITPIPSTLLGVNFDGGNLDAYRPLGAMGELYLVHPLLPYAAAVIIGFLMLLTLQASKFRNYGWAKIIRYFYLLILLISFQYHLRTVMWATVATSIAAVITGRYLKRKLTAAI